MPVKSHGESKTRLYNIWDNMKARCYRVSGRGYEHYGGRGIRICDEWLNSYEAFAKWARENGYSDDLSIDRIDVNGDYTPDNCRWVDVYVQANNRTDNVFLTVDGKTKTMSEWSRVTGINKKTIEERLKRGMSDEEAVKTPLYDPKTANIGKRFNHLIIMEYIRTEKHCNYFLCRCDCGRTGVFKGQSVFSGHRKSCGCLKGKHKVMQV